MSPRAAWRLESLGFSRVYDYAAGKADWSASGLPTEGGRAASPRAGDLARRDVPTCRLMDHTGDIRRRVRAAGWEVCVVVNDARVVLGLLRPEPVDADPQMTAEQVMESGPSTIRPHLLLDEVAQDMRKHGVESVLVTTSDGRLVGLLSRQEAERRLEEPR